MIIRYTIITFFIAINCFSQNKKIISIDTLILKNKPINYKSNIPQIEKSIKLSNNKIFESLILKDSLSSISILNYLNNNLFYKSRHNEVYVITQIEFSLEKKSENFIGVFTIQEWVYKNDMKATNHFEKILEYTNDNKNNFKVSLNWDWIQKDNLIYFISSDSYNLNDIEFIEICSLVKSVVID